MRYPRLLIAALSLSACLDLTLPNPPPPVGPGTISGRAVVAVAGRAERRPAAGAYVRLLPSGLATRADDEGLFVLEGVTRETGELLVQHDADGEGRFERQRLLRLDGFRPGLGRQVQLGDVVVEENAVIRGRVLRADVATASGHGGSVVFVPEGPFTATTADDGRFLLDNMPTGTMRLAFFRAGYASRGYEELVLSSGQELTLRDVALTPLGEAAPGALEGSLSATPAAALDAARVELTGTDGLLRVTTPTASGAFAFPQLAPDLYRLTATLAGYQSAQLVNVVVASGETTNLGIVDLHAGAAILFPDAGNDVAPADAGTTDAGGPDAGAQDAGADAGLADAGSTDAGSTDAGPDPRTPTAVVPAVITVQVGQTQVLLSGSASSDPNGLPLVFHWLQVAGPTVTLSINDALQPTTTFTAPGAAAVLRFELTVSNALGLASPAATVLVSVQAGPTAMVVPGSVSLRTTAAVDLDGRTSSDPASGTLTYDWSVVSGPLSLEAITDGGLGGDRIRVRAGASPGVGEVRLRVTNAVGLQSTPASTIIIVNTDPVVVTADAGASQLVGLGKPVILYASATSTDPGDGFSFTWLEVLADGGTPAADAGVSLSTNAGPITSFTSPSVPRSVWVRLTALGVPSGISATATARVMVVDDTPPVLVSSDPPAVGAGTPDGPWWELSATFDEALDTASIVPAHFALTENDGGVAVDVRWESATNTVRINPRRPLTLGASALLVIGGVTDASAQKNVFSTTALPFVVRAPQHRTYSAATTVTVDILPVPLITGRDLGFVGYYRPNSGCGAAPSANFFALGASSFVTPSVESTCGCARNEQRNHAVVGNRAYYACGGGDLLANTGSVFGGVASSGPLSINTDGISLGGTRAPASALDWLGLLPTGWSVPVVVNTSVVHTATNTFTFGGGVGPDRNLAAASSNTGSLRIFEQVLGGAWNNISEAVPAVGSVMPRGAYVGTTPVVCQTHQASSQLYLRCIVRSGSSWLAYENVGEGVVERIFDVQTWGDTVFVAFAQGGLVKLARLDTSATLPVFAAVPGPLGAASWNLNASCTAEAPALQVRGDGLWVAFQEKCASQWTVVLRKAY